MSRRPRMEPFKVRMLWSAVTVMAMAMAAFGAQSMVLTAIMAVPWTVGIIVLVRVYR